MPQIIADLQEHFMNVQSSLRPCVFAVKPLLLSHFDIPIAIGTVWQCFVETSCDSAVGDSPLRSLFILRPRSSPLRSLRLCVKYFRGFAVDDSTHLAGVGFPQISQIHADAWVLCVRCGNPLLLSHFDKLSVTVLQYPDSYRDSVTVLLWTQCDSAS